MFCINDARNHCKNTFLNSPFLKNNHYDETNAFLDADLLLGYILKKTRAWILSHRDFDICEYKEEFDLLVEKRKLGLPIAYITGFKEFYDNFFFVNSAVLIPKPDTELLVEEAIKALTQKIILAEKDRSKLGMLDVCTGSGCIGISVANDVYKKFQHKFDFENQFQLVLSDISYEALKVCDQNAKSILPKKIYKNIIIKKIDIRQDELIISKKYDIITANPPYVPTKITDELLSDGRSEPRLALDGGEEGLDLIYPLAIKAFNSANDNGIAFVEIGEYHSKKTEKIFKKAGFLKVEILKDLAMNPRLLKAQKS